MATNPYSANFGSANSTKSLSVANNLGIDGGNITIALWAKILAEPGTDIVFILAGQESGTAHVAYFIRYLDSTGTKIVQALRSKLGVGVTTTSYTVTLGTSNWNHFAVTYDGTTVTLYVNGVSQNTAAGNGSGNTGSSNDFFIGRQSTDQGASQFASALIDDVRVYNAALSGVDVAALYNSPSNVVTGITNLVAGYDFNSSLTTDVTGSYGLTNNGTVIQSTDVPFGGSGTTASFLLNFI